MFRLPSRLIIYRYYLKVVVICIWQGLLGPLNTGSFMCYTRWSACNDYVCCAEKGDKTMPLHFHFIFLGWLLAILVAGMVHPAQKRIALIAF